MKYIADIIKKIFLFFILIIMFSDSVSNIPEKSYVISYI